MGNYGPNGSLSEGALHFVCVENIENIITFHFNVPSLRGPIGAYRIEFSFQNYPLPTSITFERISLLRQTTYNF